MALKLLALVGSLQRDRLMRTLLPVCSGDNVSTSLLDILGILKRDAAIEYQNTTELSVGPPLPPTFEIEIFKARPLPPTTLCADPVDDTDGCVGHQGSLINSTGSDRSLLASNQTGAQRGAVIGLLPATRDTNVSW